MTEQYKAGVKVGAFGLILIGASFVFAMTWALIGTQTLAAAVICFWFGVMTTGIGFAISVSEKEEK